MTAIDTYTDHLAPQAETWKRPARGADSIVDAPAFWRSLADSDFRDSPRLADDYRRLADTLERYLPMRNAKAAP